MKILQVIPYFYPAWRFGGPVRGAYSASRELVERGHSVVVYTTDIKDEKSRIDPSSKEVDGISVFYFTNLSIFAARKKWFFTPSLVSAVRKNLKFFDIVHVHGNRTTQSPLIHHFIKDTSVPYVLQAHGGLPSLNGPAVARLYDLLFGYKLLRDASKVIALNQTEVQQYKDMGMPNSKIAIVPNGIDLEEYKKLPSKGSFRGKFSIGEDMRIILFLGRIHRIKGIDFLVRAYAYMLEKFKLNDVLLVIAGADDGYLGELKQLLSSSKIVSDHVLFTGPLYERDKLEAYMDADVFVLPSRYETFPNVVLEAYACSKPVVVSNVGSLSDIVIQGKTGLLFPAGDVQELAKMIRHILLNPEEADEMGHRARKLVEDEFSIDKVVDSLEALYKRVLEEKRVG